MQITFNLQNNIPAVKGAKLQQTINKTNVSRDIFNEKMDKVLY